MLALLVLHPCLKPLGVHLKARVIALQNFCKISNFLQNLVLIPQHSPFPTVPPSHKNPQRYQRSEFEAAHSRKVGICCGSQPQGRFCYGSQPPDNLHSTIAKPRPFRHPTKIRNVIKGRNLRRLTAARSEFEAAHSRKVGTIRHISVRRQRN